MTKEQLYALPVGTRLKAIPPLRNGDSWETIVTDKGHFVFWVRGEWVATFRRDIAGGVADMLEVIPGELDASEGVE